MRRIAGFFAAVLIGSAISAAGPAAAAKPETPATTSQALTPQPSSAVILAP